MLIQDMEALPGENVHLDPSDVVMLPRLFSGWRERSYVLVPPWICLRQLRTSR